MNPDAVSVAHVGDNRDRDRADPGRIARALVLSAVSSDLGRGQHCSCRLSASASGPAMLIAIGLIVLGGIWAMERQGW